MKLALRRFRNELAEKERSEEQEVAFSIVSGLVSRAGMLGREARNIWPIHSYQPRWLGHLGMVSRGQSGTGIVCSP